MTEPARTVRGQPVVPQTVRIPLVVLGAVVAVAAMRELAWLLTPMLLAGLMVLIAHPLYGLLRRHRVPRPLALLALLLSISCALVALAGVIVLALSRLAGLIPHYAVELRQVISDLRSFLAGIGIGDRQIDRLVGGTDLTSLVWWLTGQIPTIAGLAMTIVLVGSMLLFLGIESTQVLDRTRRIRSLHPEIFSALVRTCANIRRFIVVTSVFAVAVGVLDTVLLMMIGVPLAWLWGILAAVCNFIPYLGFVVGMVPPALLALLTGGWDAMLLVVAGYLVLNFLITSVIPAKVIGDAVGLSMFVEVVSIVFWAWVLGPVGAILAIPLTILIKSVLVDAHPRAAWLRDLLASGRDVRRRLVSDPVDGEPVGHAD